MTPRKITNLVLTLAGKPITAIEITRRIKGIAPTAYTALLQKYGTDKKLEDVIYKEAVRVWQKPAKRSGRSLLGSDHGAASGKESTLFWIKEAVPEGGVQRPDYCTTEEVDDVNEYSEGAVTRVAVNRYERDSKARRACLAHYGSRCQDCAFDFGKEYGVQFSGYIHVHHVKELSSIKKKYIVDPIKDLIPVCPNCHAIIHRQKPPYTVAEVKKIKKTA